MYYLDRTLAVCLVYCDFTGLTDDDMEVINSIDFDFNVINWCEESTDINYKCDFTRKWSYCVIIEKV
jgi:hypothetical protein